MSNDHSNTNLSADDYVLGESIYFHNPSVLDFPGDPKGAGCFVALDPIITPEGWKYFVGYDNGKTKLVSAKEIYRKAGEPRPHQRVRLRTVPEHCGKFLRLIGPNSAVVIWDQPSGRPSQGAEHVMFDLLELEPAGSQPPNPIAPGDPVQVPPSEGVVDGIDGDLATVIVKVKVGALHRL